MPQASSGGGRGIYIPPGSAHTVHSAHSAHSARECTRCKAPKSTTLAYDRTCSRPPTRWAWSNHDPEGPPTPINTCALDPRPTSIHPQ